MNKKHSEQGSGYVPYASRTELTLSVVFGCIAIALFVILAEFFAEYTVFAAVGVVLLYLVAVALLGAYRRERILNAPNENVHAFLRERCSTVLKNSKYPTAALDSLGNILWYNDAMRAILPSEKNYVGEDISEILGIGMTPESFTTSSVTVCGRSYTVEGFILSESDGGIYVVTLSDITELSLVEKRYADERVAIAYIAIDNVEDILQYVHEKFRDAVSKVDDKLKSWARSMNAVIKSYDNDKYIMFFDSSYLDECIKDRFSILDEIRDTRVGDSISVTVSIGVSRIKGSVADREAAAKEAIDLALQRGGDQAVYKTDDGIEYYGGRTKSVYKRSNIRSRTFTTELMALIARADNVLIMGHKYGDFDSFGASLGIARLAMLCGVKTDIAIDMHDKNLLPCIRMLQETEEYSQMLVDNAEGLDLVGPDTLLILVDHNTLQRAQFSDISCKVGRVVVIDHHRKIEELPPSVVLSYIEPSASSTCEMVSEMLECAASSHNIIKEEADMLLAGILLDTKRFTRNTGTRTFGAAQYLRGVGASPVDVDDLFKTEAEALSKEAKFHTSITVYRENIAISCCDKDTDESYRIVASKAADRMLSLKGIEAAFTLVRIGDHIHISGRSNGNINVQLILEKLHGGGHFDVAGAQVVADSILSVLEQLKEGIDEYLEE